MNQWRTCRLGEIGQITTGKTPKTSNKAFFEGNIHFITPTDLNNSYKYIFHTERTLSFDGLKSIYKNHISQNCICVSCIGNLGYIGIATMDCVTNQQINSIKINQKFNNDYIYYALKNLWPYFKNLEGQSTTISILNKRQFSQIELLIPPLSEQKRIAAILGALDDKIELNRRINANLEEQAKALFDYYFIQNTENLGDYQVGKLTDIAQYLNGLAMQNFPSQPNDRGLPVLKIKELGQGQCDVSSDRCSSSIKPEYIISDGDIIFSWSGTLLVDIWCGGRCGLNQHLFKVTSDSYPKWFVYFWTKYHLAKFIRIAKDKAVTMGHIKRCDLETSEVKIPNKQILTNLSDLFSPIFDAMITCRVENRKLSSLRDTLLPKLMSGEINVE